MTLPNPCIRPAAFICDRLGLGEKKCALNQELFQLNSGKKNCAREYYVRKIANTLLVSLGALILLAAVLIRLFPVFFSSLLFFNMALSFNILSARRDLFLR